MRFSVVRSDGQGFRGGARELTNDDTGLGLAVAVFPRTLS